jgi:ABC-type dipeptide/oligopeptide/nickel transport system ATPase component
MGQRTVDVFTPPYHPYMEALLSAIPVPDPTIAESRIRLEDTRETLSTPTVGCRFAAASRSRSCGRCKPRHVEAKAAHPPRQAYFPRASAGTATTARCGAAAGRGSETSSRRRD